MSQGIGTAVAEQRERLDMSISQLARATGLSRTGIRKIEQGSRSPSLGTVEKLARAFGIQPSVLLGTLDEEVEDGQGQDGAEATT